jgi:two-component system, NarL family, response regulator LiaR
MRHMPEESVDRRAEQPLRVIVADDDPLARRVVRNALVAGEAVVSRRMTMRLVDTMRRTRPDGAGIRPVRSRLTPREWEVLDLLGSGQSTDEIADALVLSSDTVRSHIKSLLRKLGVSSRKAAVQEARRMRAGLAVAGEPPDEIEAAA